MHLVQCLTHSKHGGGQQVAFLLVSALRRFYPQVRQTVLLPGGGIYVNRFREMGIQVVEFPFDSLSIFNVVHFFSILSRIKPDVIHSHGKGAGFYPRIVLPFLVHWKCIHSYHGFHPPSQNIMRRLYLALEAILLRSTDTVISVSKSEHDEVVNHFPSMQRKFVVIPNAVDIEMLKEDSHLDVPEPLNSFLNQHRGSFIVTMVGRDDRLKNYPLAIETAHKVLKRQGKVAFVFVGAGMKNQALLELALLYPRDVQVIPHLKNIAGLIARSNVLLMTSRKEGSPLVALEANALGKPVIGTNVPGIKDVIIDGRNGILCDESSERISVAIETVANDRAMYDLLCGNALTMAKSNDSETWGQQYYNVYVGRGI